MVAIPWDEILEALKPIVVKVAKKLKKELVFIPVWHSHRNDYVYHIDSGLRKSMYDYMASGEFAKKFGLAFGCDWLIRPSPRGLDMGIYGFLPFYELVHFYGKEKVNKMRVIDLYGIFEKGLKSSSKADVERAVKAANLLINFVFEKCANEQFPKMLAKGSDRFVEAHNALHEKIKNESAPIRQHFFSRFLKASFRGMYISSKGFVGLAISTNPKEFVEQAKEIAAKIGERPFEMAREFGDLKFIDRLIAVFQPKGKREIVASALGGMPAIRVIMTDELRLKKLKLLFHAFRDEMDKFDTETRLARRAGSIFYRPPAVINLYRDEVSKSLRSVCAGYNDERKEVQQIKFGGHKWKEAGARFTKLLETYFITEKEHLPSELNHHHPPRSHAD